MTSEGMRPGPRRREVFLFLLDQGPWGVASADAMSFSANRPDLSRVNRPLLTSQASYLTLKSCCTWCLWPIPDTGVSGGLAQTLYLERMLGCSSQLANRATRGVPVKALPV